MKIDAKTLILLGVIAVLCFFWFDSCQARKTAEQQSEDLASYKDTAMVYKARNGDLISYNKAIEISEKRFTAIRDSMKKEFKNLKIKNITSHTKVITVYQIDTVRQTFTDTLPCAEFTKPFTIDSLHYSLSGEITKRDITFNSISIPNNQSITVGTKRNGLFKKNEYIVALQNSNPYVNVTGIQSYTFKPDIKWYERGWVKFGAGVAVGGFIGLQLNR